MPRADIRMARRGRGRRLACAGAAVLVLAAALALTAGRPADGASGAVTVTATILSVTKLDATGCPSGAATISSFGTVLPGDLAFTSADCSITFGSTNDTASLRIGQSDGLGRAMWQQGTGLLDTAFDGDSGTADGTLKLGPSSLHMGVNDVIVQPDGKLLLAGGAGPTSTTNDVFVMRLHPDGRLDTSFDGDSGTGNGVVLIDSGSTSEYATGIAVQPDGRIVTYGYVGGGGHSDMLLARLETDGRLDATFDGPSGSANGVFRYAYSAQNEDPAHHGVSLAPDGDIVVAGRHDNGINWDLWVARFNGVDGSLDDGFDGDSGTGNGFVVLDTGTTEMADALQVLPDGAIILSGWIAGNIGVVRMLPDGRLDTMFDGDSGTANGIVRVPGSARLYAMDVDRQGRIVAAGFTTSGDVQHNIARLLPDGRLDTTFDGDSGAGNGIVQVNVTAYTDRIRGVYLGDDGRITVSGNSLDAGGVMDSVIVRLLEDGRLDTGFDGDGGTGNGIVHVSRASGNDNFDAVVGGPDGSIVVAGLAVDGGISTALVVRMAGGDTLEDYSDTVTDWNAGRNAFGACLRSVVGSVTAQWPSDGSCDGVDGTEWRPIPTTTGAAGATVATTSVSGEASAEARLRFGIRPAANQAPGDYVAPITVEVVDATP